MPQDSRIDPRISIGFPCYIFARTAMGYFRVCCYFSAIYLGVDGDQNPAPFFWKGGKSTTVITVNLGDESLEEPDH